MNCGWCQDSFFSSAVHGLRMYGNRTINFGLPSGATAQISQYIWLSSSVCIRAGKGDYSTLLDRTIEVIPMTKDHLPLLTKKGD